MPAAPVEPTIGTPTQAVGKIMVISPTDVETIEPDLGLPVGNKVTIRIRNEEQVRRTHQPDSPVANLYAGQHLHLVGKDLSRFRLSVPILVRQHDHPVP